MEHLENIYASLRDAVEKAIGRKLQTPRDFDYLSFRALDTTKQYVSAMTLKRFWGYFGTPNKHCPRLATLNILSQIAGYMDWDTYYSEISCTGNPQSAFLNKRTLYTSSLREGTIIQLKWHPNRKLVIRHDGYEVFTVIESENSKLSVGDTFRCEQITEGQTMILGGLIHEGQKFSGYVCGLEKGVLYEIIDGGEAPPCNTLTHSTLQNHLFTFRKKISRKYAPLGAQDLELWAPREIGIWSSEKQSWS